MRLRPVAFSLFGSLVVFVACAARRPQGTSSKPSARSGVELGETNASASTPDGPEYVAGTRIKPKYTTTTFADGAKSRSFSGWFDSARGEDCLPLMAADGVNRCLPNQDRVWAQDGFFSDAACSTPVFLEGLVGNCVPMTAPRYVMAGGQTPSCASTHRVFPVTGTALATTAPLYRRVSNGSCVDFSGKYPGRVLYVGPEIAPTAFVEVTTASTTG